MFLTVENRKFILKNSTSQVSEKLKTSRNWEKGQEPNTFLTTSFGAASKFRQFADKKTEKLFKKILVSFHDVPPDLNKRLPAFLDSHQIKGINWILSRSRSYLAHAPGAGKTVQSILASYFAESKFSQTLFITPPTLTLNWAREIIKWTEWLNTFPTISIIPNSNEKENCDWDAEFLICPDSMLIKPWVLHRLQSKKYKLIAVDEASRFKEAYAKRAIALFGGKYKLEKETIISKGFQSNAKHLVLLDGSPMPNRPFELWAPIYALSPETINFMSQSDFGFKYCGAKMNEFGQWEFKGATNLDELREKILLKFMHVVNEDELNHPERKRKMIFIKEKGKSESFEFEKKFLNKLKLNQLDDNINDYELAAYRKELGLKKVDKAVTYIKEKLLQNESVLVFAWHREVCELLKEKLISFDAQVVMGGTNPLEREKIFKEFQNGNYKLIIGNIIAMGRGHNLQKADRNIFVEYSWTDEVNKQCEKRSSRKGSVKLSVPCDYLVLANTLDEIVLNAVFTKAKNVKQLIG